MSQQEPDGLYVYQPYGMQDKLNWMTQRIYAIGGLPMTATISGLLREEADAIVALLLRKDAPAIPKNINGLVEYMQNGEEP